jgi:hypothetical protein
MRIKITREEYEKTEEQTRVAKLFLNNKDFQFLRDYLSNALNYAQETILTNEVHDVTDEVTISDKIKKLFFTPKKEQMDELKGQYKFIKKLLADIAYFASLKAQLDKDIANNRVFIEGGNKKDITYAK